jgi:hypothetical protein
MNAYYISQSINDMSISKLRCVKVYGGRLQYLAFFGFVSTVLLRTLAPSHLRFRNLIRTLDRTPFDGWSAHPKGLYLHRKTQHRNTRVSSGIRTHDPSNQAAKTYTLDRTAVI